MNVLSFLPLATVGVGRTLAAAIGRIAASIFRSEEQARRIPLDPNPIQSPPLSAADSVAVSVPAALSETAVVLVPEFSREGDSETNLQELLKNQLANLQIRFASDSLESYCIESIRDLYNEAVQSSDAQSLLRLSVSGLENQTLLLTESDIVAELHLKLLDFLSAKTSRLLTEIVNSVDEEKKVIWKSGRPLQDCAPLIDRLASLMTTPTPEDLKNFPQLRDPVQYLKAVKDGYLQEIRESLEEEAKNAIRELSINKSRYETRKELISDMKYYGIGADLIEKLENAIQTRDRQRACELKKEEEVNRAKEESAQERATILSGWEAQKNLFCQYKNSDPERAETIKTNLLRTLNPNSLGEIQRFRRLGLDEQRKELIDFLRSLT